MSVLEVVLSTLVGMDVPSNGTSGGGGGVIKPPVRFVISLLSCEFLCVLDGREKEI